MGGDVAKATASVVSEGAKVVAEACKEQRSKEKKSDEQKSEENN